MKKIYAIFSVFLVLASVSCTREEPISTANFENEGATVPVVLSFQNPLVLQADTKAEIGMEMGVQPAISSIHIAVFGTDRYLKDYVSAYPCDSQGNPLSGGFASQNATSAYFLARLPISSKERVLHIIANGPSSLPFNAYENDIMQNMTVTDGNGAYWQRIIMPAGINVVETDGNAEQTPDGEYIPTPETVAALSGLTLIRNFASVTVNENAANFEIVSYTICNMPRSGAVAMYSTNHGDWVPGYTDPSLTLSNYIYSYDGKNYLGFPANPDIDTNVPTTVDAFNAPGVSVGPGEPIYVYERAVTTDNPPFILMAARYVDSGTPDSSTPIHYYRLDLALESGYFPIYRNFTYGINISDVSVDGFDNLSDAAGHNSGSNFSISLDTRTLPDISNGIVRLYIEQPNFDWVYSTDTKSFWYKFLLNSASSGNLNGDVTVTEKDGGNALASFSVATSDGANDQRSVSYTLNEPNGTSTLSSTLQLVGTYTDGSDTYRLVRMVTIRVFNAKDIHPSLSPATVADEEGQLTTLSIPLPWDLQASMFPMEILIEDSAKALNPASNENMPVKTTGIENLDEPFKSLSGNNQSSYCFVRTLNWSEYQRLKNNAELSGSDDIILTCDFETTKAFSSSTVYVYNKYFATDASGVTTAQTTLYGDPDNNITPNRQNVSGTAATVKVKSTGDWVLNISMANGGVAAGASLSPSSGSSTTGQNVTVTLPENVTENAIRYKLTFTNTSSSLTRTAYITQEGIMMKLTSAITTVDNGANTVTVTVESGTSYVLEVIDPNGTVLSTSETYSATSGPTDRQVNIPQNMTNHERKFTVRARNLISTVWEDLIITQEAGVVRVNSANDEVRMTATTATVNVACSFATVLKAYVQGNDTPIYTADIAATTGRDETITGIPANTSGTSRHIIVNLCDTTTGDVLATKTLTQLGVPDIKLTTSNANIGNTTTSATINVDSEAAWTLTVDGTLSGASVSPASGSAGATNAVTLTVPVNNRLQPQTYTVTGDNGSHTGSVTVTQAAGTATLSVVDSNIWMSATSANVNVSSSFATVLKVYVPGTTDPVFTKNVAAAGVHGEALTVPVNNTGATRTIRVDLCNEDGVVVATGNISQAGTPAFSLTASAASVIGNATTTTLTLISELPCDLSVEGDGSPSISTPLGISGVVTSASGTTITLTMPVNYTTSDVTFTVKASRAGYADESVAITHRRAKVNNGSVTFDTGNGSTGQFMSSTSATSGNVTATFSAISEYASDNIWSSRDYTTLTNGTTLTINTASIPNRKALTGLSLTFSGTNYTSTSVAVQGTSATTTSTTGTSWTGEDTANETVFALSRNNRSLRVTGFTVSYQYYSWE
ncbi:MAG: BACON domain-containing protein [Bacteroidales bacterium]|nr:BACON domain-containing protein [Bacteroidales bacterium]